MRKPLSLGAVLLDRWCREHGRRASLARTLGVLGSTVTRWCDGVCTPERDRRAAVEAATGVRAETWDQPARTRRREVSP
ncbi:MAG TPA: hypothetical protein VFV33_18630 [Gemmatimonadaceae bacterium]|nr:hypothetical protein [Gemmatimonadaceae bacterium]